MEKTHLAKLQTLIKEVSKKGTRDEILQKIGFVAGEMHALAPYLSTAYIGCISKDSLPTLYGLTISLRKFGCPLLMGKGERLTPEEFPGKVWVTFSCKEEKAKMLQKFLRHINSMEIKKISNEIYLLIGKNIQDAVIFSDELWEDTMKVHMHAEKDTKRLEKGVKQ
jgi:hypothetical protein